MNEADFARITSIQDSGECSSSGTVLPLRLYISKYFGPPTGIGGLIIDDRGKCVKGFMRRLQVNFFGLKAEILAVYHGLVLLSDMGEKGAVVYLSEAAVGSIKDFDEARYPDSKLYRKICELLADTRSILCHDRGRRSYAEPAEWLAKRAVTHNIDFQVFEVLPIEMQILFHDISKSDDEN